MRDSAHRRPIRAGGGVPFVAVSFGFSDLPVEALGADAMIDAYDDLPRALAQLAARNALSSR
jgi:chaperonin GroEL (HSP60 family)